MLATLAMLISAACSRSGIEIYAPPQFAEGTVLIDGTAVAKLSKPRHNYRWQGWKHVKEELSAPPRHESAAVISELSAGVHEVSLTKPGYAPLTARVHYKPGRRTTIDLSAADVKPALARPGPPRSPFSANSL